MDAGIPPSEIAAVDAARSRAGASQRPRELIVNLGSAVAFATVAVALVMVPTDRGVDPLLLVGLVAAFAVAWSVDFEIGSGSSVPAELVLVPMLFLLPPGFVPLAVGIAAVAAHLVRAGRHEANAGRAVVQLGSAWYAVGPAVVLIAAGEPAATDVGVLVLALALLAQFAGDIAATALAERLSHGQPLRETLGYYRTVIAVDLALAPVGLMAAVVATDHAHLVFLVLPLIWLIHRFSLERQQRLTRETVLRDAYRGTALLLGDVIEADDAYTGDHCQGVDQLVSAVAIRLGLDEHQRTLAGFGALLHDVGKIRVPKEIIRKPGKLTDAEYAIVQRHPVDGEQMLRRIGGLLAEVGTIVRSHHERWDGDGYPDGLAGEEIPLLARVIAVCDTYSALTTDRSYRKARPPHAALEELRRCAGTQFDPVVVEALADALLELGTPLDALREAA